MLPIDVWFSAALKLAEEDIVGTLLLGDSSISFITTRSVAVFDDLPSKLTNQKAREIYGAEAEEAFEPTVTSTSLGDEQFAEAG